MHYNWALGILKQYQFNPKEKITKNASGFPFYKQFGARVSTQKQSLRKKSVTYEDSPFKSSRKTSDNDLDTQIDSQDEENSLPEFKNKLDEMIVRRALEKKRNGSIF